MNYNEIIKQSARLIRDTYTIIIAIFTTIIIASVIIQAITGFFTQTVCIPRWVTWASPAIAFVVVITGIFFRNRKLYKRPFKRGDQVQIIGSNLAFFVTGYHFWNYTKAKCYSQKQPDKLVFIDDALLEKYQGRPYRAVITTRDNRRF